MAFYETQFPTDISLNSKGGPKWSTVVTVSQSGKEVRSQKWSDLRGEYDAMYGVKTVAQLNTLVDFYNEMRGRAHGFRYKDWLDYSVTDEALVPDGSNTVQLIKTYGSGNNNYVRNIKKPQENTVSVTMERNSSPFGSFTLDTTTGIATLTAISSASITAITKANPGQVTTSGAHGFSNGDEIYIVSAGGMTEVNNTVFTITVVDPTNFTIGVDTSSYTTYTSGGSAEYHVQSGDTLTWSGEFDVPCRFDADHLDITLQTSALGDTAIPIVELKL